MKTKSKGLKKKFWNKKFLILGVISVVLVGVFYFYILNIPLRNTVKDWIEEKVSFQDCGLFEVKSDNFEDMPYYHEYARACDSVKSATHYFDYEPTMYCGDSKGSFFSPISRNITSFKIYKILTDERKILAVFIGDSYLEYCYGEQS